MEIHGYTLDGSINATIDGQRMTVPDDLGNRHRQMIAEWEAEGNTIPAYVPPPPPIQSLTRPAILFMMNKIGVTEATVEAIIGQMPETTTAEQDAKALALIVFRNEHTFNRDNQLLQGLTAAAGLTSAQVDTAWRTAEQIVW